MHKLLNMLPEPRGSAKNKLWVNSPSSAASQPSGTAAGLKTPRRALPALHLAPTPQGLQMEVPKEREG